MMRPINSSIRFSQFAVTIVLACFSGLASAQSYRVLLSNDDGIESPRLHALHAALSRLQGVEVVVSAPDVNQSGSSQSSIGSITVDNFEQGGRFFGYAVHGRPADAVRFGIKELGKDQPFDIVVSGINRGANVGNVSHLSGTVGAAMEGLYHGLPAIAVSEDPNSENTAITAKFTADLVDRYRSLGAPSGTMISINVPAGELKGVAVRPMGDSYLSTARYDPTVRDSMTTDYESVRMIVDSEDPTTDTYAYQQGYISVTPLKFDWTDFEMLDKVESWNLQID
ncbi:5'/3'-nucleotidase SurE [Gammaproteobacteria bacterium]|nr:5'/3'-nucleotidase SurE [Gammaproteobacteria bacterium]